MFNRAVFFLIVFEDGNKHTAYRKCSSVEHVHEFRRMVRPSEFYVQSSCLKIGGVGGGMRFTVFPFSALLPGKPRFNIVF